MDVTGVYAYQWGPSPSFRLFLRSRGDVKVIAAAPWWTLRHTGVMIAILALGACAAAFWVRDGGEAPPAAVSGGADRAQPGRRASSTTRSSRGSPGIALQLEAVGGSLAASPERAQQSLDVARRMLQYSQEEARRSVMDLRAQALESRDLAGALTDLVEQTARSAGVAARVTVEGAPRRLDAFARAPPAAHRARGAHQRVETFGRARRSTSCCGSTRTRRADGPGRRLRD